MESSQDTEEGKKEEGKKEEDKKEEGKGEEGGKKEEGKKEEGKEEEGGKKEEDKKKEGKEEEGGKKEEGKEEEGGKKEEGKEEEGDKKEEGKEEEGKKEEGKKEEGKKEEGKKEEGKGEKGDGDVEYIIIEEEEEEEELTDDEVALDHDQEAVKKREALDHVQEAVKKHEVQEVAERREEKPQEKTNENKAEHTHVTQRWKQLILDELKCVIMTPRNAAPAYARMPCPEKIQTILDMFFAYKLEVEDEHAKQEKEDWDELVRKHGHSRALSVQVERQAMQVLGTPKPAVVPVPHQPTSLQAPALPSEAPLDPSQADKEQRVCEAVKLFGALKIALSDLDKDATPAFRRYVHARLKEVPEGNNGANVEDFDALSDADVPGFTSAFKDTKPLLQTVPSLLNPAGGGEGAGKAAIHDILAEQRRLRAKVRKGPEAEAEEANGEPGATKEGKSNRKKKVKTNEKDRDNCSMEEALDDEDKKMKLERLEEGGSGDEAKNGSRGRGRGRGKGKGRGRKRKPELEESKEPDSRAKPKARSKAKESTEKVKQSKKETKEDEEEKEEPTEQENGKTEKKEEKSEAARAHESNDEEKKKHVNKYNISRSLRRQELL